MENYYKPSYAKIAARRNDLKTQTEENTDTVNRKLDFYGPSNSVSDTKFEKYVNSLPFAVKQNQNFHRYSTFSPEASARVMAAYKAKMRATKTPLTEESLDVSAVDDDHSFAEDHQIAISPINFDGPIHHATISPSKPLVTPEATKSVDNSLYTSDVEDSEEYEEKRVVTPIEIPAGIIVGKRNTKRVLNFDTPTTEVVPPAAYSPIYPASPSPIYPKVPAELENIQQLYDLDKPTKPPVTNVISASLKTPDITTNKISGEEAWLAAKAGVKSFDPTNILKSGGDLTVRNPDKRASRRPVATVAGAGGYKPRSFVVPNASQHITSGIYQSK